MNQLARGVAEQHEQQERGQRRVRQQEGHGRPGAPQRPAQAGQRHRPHTRHMAPDEPADEGRGGGEQHGVDGQQGPDHPVVHSQALGHVHGQRDGQEGAAHGERGVGEDQLEVGPVAQQGAVTGAERLRPGPGLCGGLRLRGGARRVRTDGGAHPDEGPHQERGHREGDAVDQDQEVVGAGGLPGEGRPRRHAARAHPRGPDHARPGEPPLLGPAGGVGVRQLGDEGEDGGPVDASADALHEDGDHQGDRSGDLEVQEESGGLDELPGDDDGTGAEAVGRPAREQRHGQGERGRHTDERADEGQPDVRGVQEIQQGQRHVQAGAQRVHRHRREQGPGGGGMFPGCSTRHRGRPLLLSGAGAVHCSGAHQQGQIRI